jgi:hypothetical protein
MNPATFCATREILVRQAYEPEQHDFCARRKASRHQEVYKNTIKTKR